MFTRQTVPGTTPQLENGRANMQFNLKWHHILLLSKIEISLLPSVRPKVLNEWIDLINGLDSVFFQWPICLSLFYFVSSEFRQMRNAKRPLELQIGEYVALAYSWWFWIFFFVGFSFSKLISHICVGFSLILCALFRLACFFMQSSWHDKLSFIIGGMSFRYWISEITEYHYWYVDVHRMCRFYVCSQWVVKMSVMYQL